MLRSCHQEVVFDTEDMFVQVEAAQVEKLVPKIELNKVQNMFALKW